MVRKGKNSLMWDITIISLSIAIAIIFVKTGIIINILASSKELELFGSFVAGMFFTSVFTVAPATVTLGEIAQVSSVFWTAFFGATGALSVNDHVVCSQSMNGGRIQFFLRNTSGGALTTDYVLYFDP